GGAGSVQRNPGAVRGAGRPAEQRRDHRVLSVAGGLSPAARRLRLSHRHGAAADHTGVFRVQYPLPGKRHGGPMSSHARALNLPAATPRSRVQRRALETLGWYVVLLLIASLTVLPFAWVLLTALKGPHDAIYSVPPQFIPHEPTLANFQRVFSLLPMANFFGN